jgi:hypothetical protein
MATRRTLKQLNEGEHMKLLRFAALAASATPTIMIASCENGSSGPPQLDAGANMDASIPLPEAGPGHEGGNDATFDGSNDTGSVSDTGPGSGDAAEGGPEGGACNLRTNPPVAQSLNQAGNLLLTASGEILAINGFDFPAVNPGDPVFVDGWEVRFSHFIATFDKVSLWSPMQVVTHQETVGSLVAEADGPWAVDMSQNGVGFPYLDGKETGARAVAFAVLTNQNKNGNKPFDTTGGTLYAVGFSEVTATCDAFNVNLGPEGLALYADMVQNGCVARYVGQALWKGDQGRCSTATPVDAGAEGGVSGGTGQEPEFARIPPVVNFDLCFRPRTALSPGAVETSFINCDNQDNAGPGINGEPHPRGVGFLNNAWTVGEVTFHTDHPFWESTQHDTPAHFDQFAALVTGGDGGVPTVHFEDTVGLDYTGFKDKQGNILPWRICDPNYQNPNGGARVGQMRFDPVAVPHCMNGDSSNGFCDYRDFSKYNQSTQGHWNGADGLCFVQRQYPSPP